MVNNAGISSDGDLEDTSNEVIRKVFGSNIIGSVDLTKAALPQLKNNNGGVVFMSSLAAVNGLGGHSIYSAAKVAMVSIAQSLKKELAETNVHVGYTYLGFTENDADKRTLNPQGVLETIPTRPGIKPMSQVLAANKILKQIESRNHRSIHSTMGKAIYSISRVSESLTNFILLKGCRAERAFLMEVNEN